MEINHNFCVAAYKVISRSPIASYYTDLKSRDSSSHETVELYMDALKEMVIYHNELLPSGKFDNNQLLRFNSLAIKLLKGYSNGVIPRLPQLPTIEKRPMNIIKTIKSWFASTPEVDPNDTVALIEKRRAELQAQVNAKQAEAKELLAEKREEEKQARRTAKAATQLKVTAGQYAKAVKTVEVLEEELAQAKTIRADVELEALDVLKGIDAYIEDLLASEEADEPREQVKSRDKTTIPATSASGLELEDLWAEEEKEVEEPKTEVSKASLPPLPPVIEQINKPTGRSRKPKTTKIKGGTKTETENKGGTKTRKRPSVSELTVAETTKIKGGKSEEKPYEPKNAGEEGALVAAADTITAIDSFDD